MTVREEQRLVVFNALERSEVTMAEAARLLRLSVRQVRRLRAAYRRRGVRALVHGNRGRPSRRRLAEAVRRRIVHLARSRYAQANHVHLQELLARHEGLHIAYTSLRRILHAAGLRTPRTRRLQVMGRNGRHSIIRGASRLRKTSDEWISKRLG